MPESVFIYVYLGFIQKYERIFTFWMEREREWEKVGQQSLGHNL